MKRSRSRRRIEHDHVELVDGDSVHDLERCGRGGLGREKSLEEGKKVAKEERNVE
jgi:hypothetical protein